MGNVLVTGGFFMLLCLLCFLFQQTYIGDILVALNPFKYLPLYEKEVGRPLKSALPPHIFAVADRAYQSMLGRLAAGPKNQCIVISGESGAGKTESTKLLLRQIMELCKANSQLEQQILQVNPLLEAFGNAQTVMNDNSSRFGKYIQLRFFHTSVKGAKINEYLLEKSRVVHQDEGERNFHIFYCMLAGISKEDKEIYGLLDPLQYRYNSDDMLTHWSTKYREVCNAMDMVGFEEQEKVDMLTILAGILSLGNIAFEPTDSDGMKVTEMSVGWLKAAAGQFGVKEEELLKSLTCTMSVTRGEAIQRLHNQQQAEDARDSIAKVAYGRIFGWIVSKVNELLAPKVDPDVELSEIGILDIFGFENFAVNRFEQLCINLANEQLQFFFNHHIFLMEQKEYKEEGIEWEVISFKDNKPILVRIEFPLQYLLYLATNRDFVDKLNNKFKGTPHYEVVQGFNPLFTVIHYAGKVQYNAGGFLEKNRDTIPASIRGMFINSVTPLLSVLFAATISRTGTLMPRKAKVCLSLLICLSFIMQHSLGVLMEKMFAASPHFIRCVKPNSSKLPDLLDDKLVMAQLRYNGLLETVRIRRDGFSWRPSFAEFAERCMSIFILNVLKLVVLSADYRSVRCRRRYLALLKELQRKKEEQQELEERKRKEEEEELQRLLLIEQEKKSKNVVAMCIGLWQMAMPFDNDLYHLLGQPPHEEQAKEKHKQRRNTIRWFKETQARKVVQNGTVPCWFHGMISRRQAEDLLIDKPTGCFLIRVGQSREGYTLTYRGENRCRHYMIEMQNNGKYVILGEDRAHSSLPDLVEYHRHVGIQPFMELLTETCGQVSSPFLFSLFMPLDQSPVLQPSRPPALRKIRDKKSHLPTEQFNMGDENKAFPRLYPSIRLAMREIKEIQQVRSDSSPPDMVFMLLLKRNYVRINV
uniref:Uncharacterized protein n=1 Tax=Denticeps clupeoides TaxID=299321 RepID=A0AAY4AW28_9TELE